MAFLSILFLNITHFSSTNICQWVRRWMVEWRWVGWIDGCLKERRKMGDGSTDRCTDRWIDEWLDRWSSGWIEREIQ